MSQELGKIEKPEAEQYKKGRKIYLVPLIYAGEKVPQDYLDKFDLYWKQVDEHVENLETKIGQIRRIYHESVSDTGEAVLGAIERLNPKSSHIIEERCKKGAYLETLEEKDLLEETLDWQRCLLIGFMNQKVAEKVSNFYIEAAKKRYVYMAKKIDETLLQDEAAVLFINERHMVQFPNDIEVFRVAPPALDEIYKWLRSRQEAGQEEK